MIPVYLKTNEEAEPPESTHYMLAANGVFLVKKTQLFASVTRATTVAGLEPQTPSLVLSLPKLPRNLGEQIYGFFQHVYERLDGEAVVFLYYSPATGDFKVEAPPQQLTRFRTQGGWRTEGRVQYRTIVRPVGYLKLGDAHSHGDGSAFFSSTDDDDDEEDGLRIVMGRLDRANPDICVSFVANRTRFELEPADVLENFDNPLLPCEAWIRRVSCRYKDLSKPVRYDHDRQESY